MGVSVSMCMSGCGWEIKGNIFMSVGGGTDGLQLSWRRVGGAGCRRGRNRICN